MKLKELIVETLAVIGLIGATPLILLLTILNWLMPNDEDLAKESYEN